MQFLQNIFEEMILYMFQTSGGRSKTSHLKPCQQKINTACIQTPMTQRLKAFIRHHASFMLMFFLIIVFLQTRRFYLSLNWGHSVGNGVHGYFRLFLNLFIFKCDPNKYMLQAYNTITVFLQSNVHLKRTAIEPFHMLNIQSSCKAFPTQVTKA